MLLKRDSISLKVLRKLYLDQGLSTLDISKQLGFSQRTIHLRLKECNIPLREPGPPRVTIPRQKLEQLYLKKRLSSRKIAKIYNCAYSTVDRIIRNYGLPIYTLAAAHIVTPRQDFSGNLKEKAYLIGFRIGDLRVRKFYRNSETILIDCASTYQAQISLINSLFSRYGRVWISKPTDSGKVQIECGVNLSFKFLLRKFERFPSWTLQTKLLFLSILAGFTDAEGSFFLTSNKRVPAFSIGNYNKTILEQIQQYLFQKFDIHSRLFMGAAAGYTGKDGYSHNADYWILSIHRKSDLFKFATILLPHLRYSRKKAKAEEILVNIKLRNYLYH